MKQFQITVASSGNCRGTPIGQGPPYEEGTASFGWGVYSRSPKHEVGSRINVICVASSCRSPTLGYQRGYTSIEMVKHAGSKQKTLLIHSRRQFRQSNQLLPYFCA